MKAATRSIIGARRLCAGIIAVRICTPPRSAAQGLRVVARRFRTALIVLNAFHPLPQPLP